MIRVRVLMALRWMVRGCPGTGNRPGTGRTAAVVKGAPLEGRHDVLHCIREYGKVLSRHENSNFCSSGAIVVYSDMNTVRSLITALELQPHPEGGWYREVFRSTDRFPPSALPERYLGSRSYVTSIYFLLQAGEVSRFHRLRSDEVWHFYDGAPLTLHLLHPDGSYAAVCLGRDPRKGEQFVVTVPRGVWMGAEGPPGKKFSLVGCTTAPGFDFNDFELAPPDELFAAYPGRTDIIQKLTTY